MEGTPSALERARAELYEISRGLFPEHLQTPLLEITATEMSHPEAIRRARSATDILVRSQRYIEWLAQRRDEAVREMRTDGSSYDDVAQALGVSKSRAQQLCRRIGATGTSGGYTQPTRAERQP